MSKRTVSKGKIQIVIFIYTYPKFGSKMYVPRRKGQIRKNNHKKKLYCTNCKKRLNFIQDQIL